MDHSSTTTSSSHLEPAPLAKNPLSIDGAQRRALRALGHHLEPVLHIGHSGVTDGVVRATSEQLERHELIKIAVLADGPVGRKDAPHLVADRAGAHVAQIVGRTALLYRRRFDNPRVELPGSIVEAPRPDGEAAK